MAQDDKQGVPTLQTATISKLEITEVGEGDIEETALQDLIGDRLRQYYDQRLSEPLPDKFASLLKQLAKAENKE